MPTRFLTIKAVQSPFDIGTDGNGRHMFSCNYDCELVGATVSTWEEDFLSILVDSSIISISLCLIGMKKQAPMSGPDPASDGPFLRLISTGGQASNDMRGEGKLYYPSFQVITFSQNSGLANDLAMDVYHKLDGLRNVNS